ncbi:MULTISPECIES: hypothetical protein [Nostocales]|uniref:hypothetical protein n=1 Tax=Nostocales TaxID=1161 RepID=UPI001687F454|nr:MULTISPECIES: hypothetical protein [Nostocales]MBD2298250.1 hypothetical protein [Nostoc sp. FACHB-190]MBD2488798.1 hypothetical protein [Aulosira sp. FACHB-615]
MNKDEKSVQKDALIMLILLIVAGFGACSIFKGSNSESSSESRSDCFDRVSQEMARREGNKVVNQADISRYQSELLSRCR